MLLIFWKLSKLCLKSECETGFFLLKGNQFCSDVHLTSPSIQAGATNLYFWEKTTQSTLQVCRLVSPKLFSPCSFCVVCHFESLTVTSLKGPGINTF